jgi:bacterioferritin-associated ferredoxin
MAYVYYNSPDGIDRSLPINAICSQCGGWQKQLRKGDPLQVECADCGSEVARLVDALFSGVGYTEADVQKIIAAVIAKPA